jgi:GMP synthase (glutamine-hydrolysing)
LKEKSLNEKGARMILIVDFGGQTAHLIGRRLRQLGVEIEYAEPESALALIKKTQPKGIIFSGGPADVFEQGSPTIDTHVFELGIPILGICYGWQLMAHLLGGVVKTETKEYGPETLHMASERTFNLPETSFQVFMSHGNSVVKLPEGFAVLGSTDRVKNAAVQDTARCFFGLLFHPEAHDTEHGLDILQYFAETICGEEMKPFSLDPKTLIADIKKKVGKNKVIFAVSGGVDSTVAAALVGKAIGKQLIPVYVDSGLMRPHTKELVQQIFTDLIPADLVIVEAKARFMAALKGVEDPEVKRKAIGKLYIDIFQEQAALHQDATFLGQGTIYSDVIESKGSKHASHIKSHHNVGGLPKDLGFELLEPVRNFYKDEVRELGRLVGLPEETVMQQPMPGPGYAVRIRGEVTEKRLEQVIKADTIVMEEVKQAGFYERVFQCFAVMSGAYSTAVKGDGRVFAEVVAVRAYESKDVMTSHWAQLPYETLQRISSRIVNEVPDVSRVVYDITTKPPATMEWE